MSNKLIALLAGIVALAAVAGGGLFFTQYAYDQARNDALGTTPEFPINVTTTREGLFNRTEEIELVLGQGQKFYLVHELAFRPGQVAGRLHIDPQRGVFQQLRILFPDFSLNDDISWDYSIFDKQATIDATLAPDVLEVPGFRMAIAPIVLTGRMKGKIGTAEFKVPSVEIDVAEKRFALTGFDARSNTTEGKSPIPDQKSRLDIAKMALHSGPEYFVLDNLYSTSDTVMGETGTSRNTIGFGQLDFALPKAEAFIGKSIVDVEFSGFSDKAFQYLESQESTAAPAEIWTEFANLLLADGLKVRIHELSSDQLGATGSVDLQPFTLDAISGAEDLLVYATADFDLFVPRSLLALFKVEEMASVLTLQGYFTEEATGFRSNIVIRDGKLTMNGVPL